MATSTITGPVTFAQMETAGWSHDHVFAAQEALMALADLLDPLNTGMLSFRGDLAGSNSDTLRITEYDGIGFAARMDSLSTETSPITPREVVAGYTDLTVGYYGIGHSMTYYRQALQTPGMGLDFFQLMARAPQSILATLRYLACVQGATIATSLGADADPLDFDTAIAIMSGVREGFAAIAGLPQTTLAPQQFTQLLTSIRAEPAFQANTGEFAAIQGLVGQVVRNFADLGLDFFLTDDVVQSGGGYQGFTGSPGFMGWGRASMINAVPTGVVRSLYMGEFGALLNELASANGLSQYEMRAILGVALGSTNVFYQRRVKSAV